MNYKLILVSILFTASPIFAQQLNVQKSNEHFKNAVEFFKEKNYSKSIEELTAANELRPNYPRYLYSLASIYSTAGEGSKALKVLNKIASFKIYFDIEKDSDFVSLFKTNEFIDLKNKFNSNLTPVIKSKHAFSLNEKDLLTEGIAYNPVTERFYISSVHKGKIIEVNSRGVWRDFVKEGEFGLWGNFGLKVDVKRQILWVCSGAVQQTRGIKAAEIGKAGLIAYNLRNGKLIKKYLLKNAGEEHLFGDLTLSPGGDIFVTDSKAKIIYKLSRGKNKIEEFITSTDFISLQGLALSPDDKFLFVADYSSGLHRINLKTKEKIVLFYPEDLTVLGIDGLYFYENNLIAIQNGVSPHRVLKLSLDKNNTGIISWKILESNNPLFDEPTLGVISGSYLFFIANSQWENFNEKGEISFPEKLKKPTILKLPLE